MLLLDENIDIRFKNELKSESVFTLLDLGWVGLKNGELREKINEKGFQFLVTADKILPFQQNFSKVNFIIILLDSPTLLWEHLSGFVPTLAKLLKQDFTNSSIKIIHICLVRYGKCKRKAQLQKVFSESKILFIES